MYILYELNYLPHLNISFTGQLYASLTITKQHPFGFSQRSHWVFSLHRFRPAYSLQATLGKATQAFHFSCFPGKNRYSWFWSHLLNHGIYVCILEIKRYIMYINIFVSCIYQVVLDSFHQELQSMVFIFYCWTLDMYIIHSILCE